jgi:hypothetical protein
LVSGPATSARDTGDRPDLSALLLKSLEELAAAGNVEMACRIAGQACMALRRNAPGAEHRFNALLHRLARRLSW